MRFTLGLAHLALAALMFLGAAMAIDAHEVVVAKTVICLAILLGVGVLIKSDLCVWILILANAVLTLCGIVLLAAAVAQLFQPLPPRQPDLVERRRIMLVCSTPFFVLIPATLIWRLMRMERRWRVDGARSERRS